jgi:sec-independent protein translocase protein TatA
MLSPIAIGMPGGAEWIIIAAIGLLLFGKRLPEVGRSLGKGIVEFKKGLKGVEDDMETASNAKTAQPMLGTQTAPAAQALPSNPQPAGTTGGSQFKFDPYTGKPIENSASSQT